MDPFHPEKKKTFKNCTKNFLVKNKFFLKQRVSRKPIHFCNSNFTAQWKRSCHLYEVKFGGSPASLFAALCTVTQNHRRLHTLTLFCYRDVLPVWKLPLDSSRWCSMGRGSLPWVLSNKLVCWRRIKASSCSQSGSLMGHEYNVASLK